MKKGISALNPQTKPNSEKKGHVKYLAQVLQDNGDFLPSRVGFIGESCPLCVQYFDGTQKTPKAFNGLRQMPKVFNKKKDAQAAIKEAKKFDKAFGEKHIYELVPIEIFK